MAMRMTFSVLYYWKNARTVCGNKSKHRRTFRLKLCSLRRLYKTATANKESKQLFLKDNITTPFFKHVGCRLLDHRYRYVKYEGYAFCTRCDKVIDIEEKEFYRATKMRRIKKKTRT